MSVQGRGRCKVQTLHGTALQRYSVAKRADPLVGALQISTQGHAWLGTS